MSLLVLQPGQKLNITAYAQFPAAFPPPGVTPNFINPPHDRLDLLIVDSLLVAIMLCFVGCRAYCRVGIMHQVTLDDWCLLLGVAFTLMSYVGSTMSVTWGVVGIQQYNMKVYQVANNATSSTTFFFGLGGYWAPPFIKLSFFLLFWTLFGQRRWIRITLLIGGTLITIVNFGCAIACTYFGAPGPGEDFTTHGATGKSNISLRLAVPVAAIAIATDLFILIVPLIAVSNLQMKPRKKLAMVAVFFSAALAVVASIVNLYYRVQLVAQANITGTLRQVMICSIVEYTVGICCACAPAVSHVMRVHSPLSTLRSRVSSLLRRATRGRTSESAVRETRQSTIPVAAGGPSPHGPPRIGRGLSHILPSSLFRTSRRPAGETDPSEKTLAPSVQPSHPNTHVSNTTSTTTTTSTNPSSSIANTQNGTNIDNQDEISWGPLRGQTPHSTFNDTRSATGSTLHGSTLQGSVPSRLGTGTGMGTGARSVTGTNTSFGATVHSPQHTVLHESADE